MSSAAAAPTPNGNAAAAATGVEMLVAACIHACCHRNLGACYAVAAAVVAAVCVHKHLSSHELSACMLLLLLGCQLRLRPADMNTCLYRSSSACYTAAAAMAVNTTGAAAASVAAGPAAAAASVAAGPAAFLCAHLFP
jgi:hypothetical protein